MTVNMFPFKIRFLLSTICMVHFSALGIRAEKCDYLIVTPGLFSVQAKRLADLRHTLTPNVAKHPCIIQMADVYRDYPVVGPKWKSLQNFLKASYELNKPDLAHVVLLGDASLD